MTYSLPLQGKVIELGGGNNPLLRPNVDIRQGPAVDIVADLNERLPLESNSWDGVFCRYAIEHISWRKVRDFIAEVYRILAPGGQAVFVTANLLEQARMLVELPFEDRWVCQVFGDCDYPENSHKCGFSPEFAGRLFSEAGFDRVIVTPLPEWKGDMVIEVRKGKMDLTAIPEDDGLLKANIGSFTVMFHGWCNLDILPLDDYAQSNGYKFYQRDCRQGLPFDNDTVDLMYSSHFLEHLTYQEGKAFLGECKRVMKPGATLRLILPDTEKLTEMYQHKELGQFDSLNEGCKGAKSQAEKLWAILLVNHQAIYDWETIRLLAEELGLQAVHQEPGRGHEKILRETKDMFPELSLFVEIKKG